MADGRALTRSRQLDQLDPGDLASVQAFLTEQERCHGKMLALAALLERVGAERYEQLRVDLWVHLGDEVLVAPIERGLDRPTHLIGRVNDWRSNVPTGSLTGTCARQTMRPIPRGLWRWSQPTCRNCDNTLASTRSWRLKRIVGSLASGFAQMVATEEQRSQSRQEAVEHHRLRVARDLGREDATLDEVLAGQRMLFGGRRA